MASGIFAAIARPSGRERLGHLLGLRALPLGGAMAFLLRRKGGFFKNYHEI
jgi:hypothetical protein